MAHYKITAPDRKYTGNVGGVGFYKGVARVEAEGLAAELAYFARKGYVVELVEEAPAPAEPADEKPVEDTKPPARPRGRA